HAPVHFRHRRASAALRAARLRAAGPGGALRPGVVRADGADHRPAAGQDSAREKTVGDAPGPRQPDARRGGLPAAPAGDDLVPGPVPPRPRAPPPSPPPPIYPRGPEFIRRFAALRRLLGELAGGRSVAVLNGSGTLANEAVAAALAATPGGGRGVLLSNGEF